MARKLRYDWLLFVATFALVSLGVIMVYSASSFIAQQKFGDSYYFLSKQVAFVLTGGLLVAVMMRVDYHVFEQPSVVWSLIGASVLALIFVYVSGAGANGARRWLGIAGIGIQPSEFAKFAAVVFTAALLHRKMERIDAPREVLAPVSAMLGVMAGLILIQPDLGTAVTLVVAVAVMLFTAGVRWTYIAGATLAALPVLAVLLATSWYRMQRLRAFLNPWADPQGMGWQTIQSILAVARGGVTGLGLGEGIQKRFYLPEPHNDFIYAVVAEELGMIGALVILVAFLVIAWRGIVAAINAPDRFGTFLALGLTTVITFQALLNISVVLALVPTKGIPLPFVSAGGSSLLVSFLAIGVLLNVSQHASARL
jgi:cell division protein FtsW